MAATGEGLIRDPDVFEPLGRGLQEATAHLETFRERLKEANDRADAFLRRPGPAAGFGGAAAFGLTAGLAAANERAARRAAQTVPGRTVPSPVDAAARTTAAGLNTVAGAARSAAIALASVQNRPSVAVPTPRPSTALQPLAPAGRVNFVISQALIAAQNVILAPAGRGPARERLGEPLRLAGLPVARRLPVGIPLPTAQRLPPLATALPPLVPRGTPVGTPVSFPQARPVAFPTATPIAAAAAQTNAFAGALGKADGFLGKLRDRLDPFVQRVRFGFAVATASVVGFARAGLQETVEGYQLGLAFTRLSREIAGIFLPVVTAATKVVNRMADALGSLSGRQQDQILKWGLIAAGVGTFIGFVPRIVGGLQSVAAAGRAAAVSILGMELAAAGPIGIAVAAAAAGALVLAAGFAVAYARSEELRDSTARFAQVIQSAFVSFGPIISAAISYGASTFTTAMIAITAVAEHAAIVFAGFWNAAIDGVRFALLELADVMADLAKIPALNRLGVDFQGAAAGLNRANEALLKARANPLLQPPALGGGPGGQHRLPTPLQVGRESGTETYNRLQDAVYRALSGQEDPQQKQINLLEQANGWLQQIAGGAGQPEPAPVIQH
jgi:hypothetical protein